MEVILKEAIINLGEIGDVVKVKPGYGRNYLIPTGRAAYATSKNLRILSQENIVAWPLKIRSSQWSPGIYIIDINVNEYSIKKRLIIE